METQKGVKKEKGKHGIRKKKRKERKAKRNKTGDKINKKQKTKKQKKPPFNTPQHSLFLVGSNNFFPFKTYIARWTIFDTRPPLILVTLFN